MFFVTIIPIKNIPVLYLFMSIIIIIIITCCHTICNFCKLEKEILFNDLQWLVLQSMSVKIGNCSEVSVQHVPSPRFLWIVANARPEDLHLIYAIFLFQTVSVSMLLRYSHHQIFVFIGESFDLYQYTEPHGASSISLYAFFYICVQSLECCSRNKLDRGQHI